MGAVGLGSAVVSPRASRRACSAPVGTGRIHDLERTAKAWPESRPGAGVGTLNRYSRTWAHRKSCQRNHFLATAKNTPSTTADYPGACASETEQLDYLRDRSSHRSGRRSDDCLEKRTEDGALSFRVHRASETTPRSKCDILSRSVFAEARKRNRNRAFRKVPRLGFALTITCTLLALLRKCLIMNGAGEGNRTLVIITKAGLGENLTDHS